MKSDLLEKQTIQLEIKSFLEPFRCGRGTHIPDVELPRLSHLFHKLGHIAIDYQGEGILSSHEKLVIGLSLLQFDRKEIAETLSISPNTVSTYVKRVREKMAANTKQNAIFSVLRKRIITISD